MGKWRQVLRQKGRHLLVGGAVLSALSCGGDSNGPATTGAVEIRTTTAGPSSDPDGYTVQVDDGDSQPIGIGARLTVSALVPGVHSVLLAGLASNCGVVFSDNPKNVTIVAETAADAAFTIYCNHPAP